MELPEENLTQQEKDQRALEQYQRKLAIGHLYEAQENPQEKSSEKFLSTKGHLRFVSQFTKEAIPRAAKAIREALDAREEELKDAPAGTEKEVTAALDKITAALTHDQIALIALSNILRGVQTGSRSVLPEHKITRQIAEELDFEACIAYLNNIDPALLSYISKRNLTEPNTRRNKMIKGTLATIDDFYDIEWHWMDDNTTMRVGAFIRHAIFEELGYFELIRCFGANGHKQYAIVLSATGARKLDRIMEAVEESVSKNFFMIAEPHDWDEEGIGGGWHTMQPYPMNVLVRNSMGTKVSKQAITALNALQKTQWEINPFIFNILNTLLETNVEIGSFRAFNEELYSKVDNPLLLDPDDLTIPWNDQNLSEEDTRRRNMAYRVSKLWQQEKGLAAQKALSPRMVVKMAEFFLFHQFGHPSLQPAAPEAGDTSEEAKIQQKYHDCFIPVPDDDTRETRHYQCFYSPWFMDNRTRCYPGVDTVNCQGSDYQKALMLFYQGTPATRESQWDLLVSIATTYGNGIDKRSYFSRARWAYGIRDLMKLIVAEPMKPTSMEFWRKSDEPFQFLALCQEYVNIFEYGIWEYHRVSAGRDATCSGIQITGAMLRDSRTCKLVNVLPSPKPQDAYSDVAKEARKLLKDKEWLMEAVEKREKSRKKRFQLMHDEFLELKAEGKRQDNQAPPPYIHRGFDETRMTILDNLDFIDRGVAKMPTMLIPYGGSFLTIYGHVKEKLKSKGAGFHTADYTIVTKALIEGMGNSLPAFSEVNAWFQSLAKAALAVPLEDGEKYSITWETPAGSSVRQEYMKPKYASVTTFLGDNTRTYTNLKEDINFLNESKMRTALAANVVHSIDASIIQKAVNYIMEQNPGFQFTAVHDCIYGPSGSFRLLLEAIRKAFYECVKENITEHIAENNLPNEEYRKLIPVLKQGSARVTLNNILKSQYLFS